MPGEGSPPPRPPKPKPLSYSNAARPNSLPAPPVPQPPVPPAAAPPIPPKPPARANSKKLAADDMAKLLAPVDGQRFHSSAPAPRAQPPSYSSAAAAAAAPPPATKPRVAVQMPETQDSVVEESSDDHDSNDELILITAQPAKPPHERQERGRQPSAWGPPGRAAVKPAVENWTGGWQQPHNTHTRWDEQMHVVEVKHTGADSAMDGDDGWDASTPTAPASPTTEGYIQSLTDGGAEMERGRSSSGRRRRRDRSFGVLQGLSSGWTTPKVVEHGGRPEANGGIWGDKSVTDFLIEKPPKEGGKYPAMGATIVRKRGRARSATVEAEVKGDGAEHMEVDGAGESSGEEVRMDDSDLSTSARAPSASIDLPAATYRTITAGELKNARPHPNLYYSRSMHSWALFVQLRSEDVDPSPTVSPYWGAGPPVEGKTPLWRVQPLDADEIVPEVEPPIPFPVGPAIEASLSKESSIVADDSTSTIDKDAITLIQNQKGRRVAFSVLDFYPAVIPQGVWEAFRDDRRDNPALEGSVNESWYKGVSVIWIAIDNLLFKGEYRPVKLDALRRNLTWNAIAADIFVGFLGFKYQADDSLDPPDVSEDTEESREARRRLLQCWLEVGLWIENHKLLNVDKSAGKVTRVKLRPADPALINTLGGDSLPRQPDSQRWIDNVKTSEDLTSLRRAYDTLGVTCELADSVIVDVFRQQLAANSLKGQHYLQAIEDINKHRHSEELTLLLASERSKGGYTQTELDNAYVELRLDGPPSGWPFLEEEVIGDAYNKREEEVTHPDRKRVLREAVKVIATSRGSDYLKILLESSASDEAGAKPQMTLERAYRLLELPADVAAAADDSLVCTMYDVALNNIPAQKAALNEALKAVADARNSEEIRKYLKSSAGADAGWEAGPSVALDIPVGLTNIANTCYLNSLLQYFFTVRELRETILQFANGPASDHGTQKNRVGGRLVTKAEVERSKRFVELLQGLFSSLIAAPVSAVTPETELAYLALVPSKDEAEIKKPAVAAPPQPDVKSGIKPTIKTDDDDDDDLIIIDPATARESSSPVIVPSPASPDASAEGIKSPSVLGKRRNDQLDGSADTDLNIEPMHIDSASPDVPHSDQVMADDLAPLSPVSNSSRKLSGDEDDRSAKRGRSLEASVPALAEPDMKVKPEEDVSMDIKVDTTSLPSLPDQKPTVEEQKLGVDTKPAPPPLPPRPTTNKQSELEQQVSTYMAFGRQNDVTECMDNVMFQIECALKPNTDEGEESAAAGVLKRTFYGKTRQQLEFSDTSISEPIRTKEEPFFSLLVDVAEEGRNVYDGLDAVFDDSPVEIEGKRARRRVSLVEVPALLQIQLQRVQYDREKQKIFKSNQHMAFGPEISLDRYLQVDDDDVEGKRRRNRTTKYRKEIEKCRARLSKLKSKTIDVPQTLLETFNHLSHQPDLADVLSSEMSEETVMEQVKVKEEVVRLETRIKELRQDIEELWADQQKATYELVSVFIHRGTALSGHYFIYQRDSKNPKRWLKYNDSIITEIDPAEAVFAETTGDTNAYFLVYCKKDRLDAIDSMCRQL